MITPNDTILLIYSGRHWFGMVFEGTIHPTEMDEGYWTSYAKGKSDKLSTLFTCSSSHILLTLFPLYKHQIQILL